MGNVLFAVLSYKLTEALKIGHRKHKLFPFLRINWSRSQEEDAFSPRSFVPIAIDSWSVGSSYLRARRLFKCHPRSPFSGHAWLSCDPRPISRSTIHRGTEPPANL